MVFSFSWAKVCLVLVTMVAMLTIVSSAVPANASAASTAKAACSPSFFGLEPWWKYLGHKAVAHQDSSGKTYYTCEIKEKSSDLLGKNSFILLIVLAVIDDLLRVAGLVAVVFVIIGGFKFITAQGEPEQAASARETLMFALVGLVIALLAVVIVSLIGSSLGPKS